MTIRRTKPCIPKILKRTLRTIDSTDSLIDVRLGDFVVSLHSKSSDTVVQYDFGKSVAGGELNRTGTLNKPPRSLLSAVSMIRMQHKRKGHTLSQHLTRMIADNLGLAKEFDYPGSFKDRACKPTTAHTKGKRNCRSRSGLGDINLVPRKRRESASLVVHYGTIGSPVSRSSDERCSVARQMGKRRGHNMFRNGSCWTNGHIPMSDYSGFAITQILIKTRYGNRTPLQQLLRMRKNCFRLSHHRPFFKRRLFWRV